MPTLPKIIGDPASTIGQSVITTLKASALVTSVVGSANIVDLFVDGDKHRPQITDGQLPELIFEYIGGGSGTNPGEGLIPIQHQYRVSLVSNDDDLYSIVNIHWRIFLTLLANGVSLGVQTYQTVDGLRIDFGWRVVGWSFIESASRVNGEGELSRGGNRGVSIGTLTVSVTVDAASAIRFAKRQLANASN